MSINIVDRLGRKVSVTVDGKEGGMVDNGIVPRCICVTSEVLLVVSGKVCSRKDTEE